jgi:hypothetical protein
MLIYVRADEIKRLYAPVPDDAIPMQARQHIADEARAEHERQLKREEQRNAFRFHLVTEESIASGALENSFGIRPINTDGLLSLDFDGRKSCMELYQSARQLLDAPGDVTLYAINQDVREVPNSGTRTLSVFCGQTAFRYFFVRAHAIPLDGGEEDEDEESFFVLTYLFIRDSRPPVRFFRPAIVRRSDSFPDLWRRVQAALGTQKDVPGEAWLIEQFGRDCRSLTKLHESQTFEDVNVQTGDSLVFQFREVADHPHFNVKRPADNVTFSYLELVDLRTDCNTYFELLDREFTLTAAYNGNRQSVRVPHVLSIADFIDFLIDYVFQIERKRGTVYVVYSERGQRPLEALALLIGSVTVTPFKYFSDELIQKSIRIRFKISEDAISMSPPWDVVFADGCRVEDLIRYVGDGGLVPPDGALRVLSLDNEIIDKVLPASYHLKKVRNPVRVDVVPGEQVEADSEDMIVVVYRRKRRLTQPNKFSFLLEVFAREEFVETKRRIEAMVRKVLSGERSSDWRYVLEQKDDEDADLDDDDVLKNEIDDGCRLVVRPKQTMRVVGAVHVRQQAGPPIRLLN